MQRLEEELNELMGDYREARGQRHKGMIAVEIERLENQFEELEKRRDTLKEQIGAMTVTDNQILTFKEFAQKIKECWNNISRDFDGRRSLIEQLNIQVTLDLDEHGRKLRV